MILVGELSLWVALLMAAWGTMVSLAGGWSGREELVWSGERALHASFAFVLLASLGLWSALLSSELSVQDVAAQTSANLPTLYKVVALWASPSGSLLFWALILTLCSTVAVLVGRRHDRARVPFVSGTLSAIALLLLLALCLGENPYARMDVVPPDGRGMPPRLQSPGMVALPPIVYLGYGSAAVPFAYAIAALLTRRLDREWLGAMRRWSLFSWLCLTIGAALGMWWAYVERGPGSDWVWTPVENASLLPWVTTTAFLHSILVWEKRGMFGAWSVTLVVSTFLLSLLGIFVTRSWIVPDARSFAHSGVRYWFAGFALVAIAVTAHLAAKRLDGRRARATLASMASREASVLAGNLLLVGIALSAAWGALFPLVDEAMRGERRVIVPLGVLLFALTGIGPLLAWRRTSIDYLRRQLAAPVICGIAVGALLLALGMRHPYSVVAYTLAAFVAMAIVREIGNGVTARRRLYGESASRAIVRLLTCNRRRCGGYIVHAGIVVIVAALAGLSFRREYGVTLRAGETYSAVDPFGTRWSFTSDGIYTDRMLNRDVTGVSLRAVPDGGRARLITSEVRQHFDARWQPTFEPSTESGILTRARQDVYVVLAAVRGDVAETVELRIAFIPLVAWIWVGGLIMMAGALLVVWPRTEQGGTSFGHVAPPRPEPAAARV